MCCKKLLEISCGNCNGIIEHFRNSFLRDMNFCEHAKFYTCWKFLLAFHPITFSCDMNFCTLCFGDWYGWTPGLKGLNTQNLWLLHTVWLKKVFMMKMMMNMWEVGGEIMENWIAAAMVHFEPLRIQLACEQLESMYPRWTSLQMMW